MFVEPRARGAGVVANGYTISICELIALYTQPRDGAAAAGEKPSAAHQLPAAAAQSLSLWLLEEIASAEHEGPLVAAERMPLRNLFSRLRDALAAREDWAEIIGRHLTAELTTMTSSPDAVVDAIARLKVTRARARAAPASRGTLFVNAPPPERRTCSNPRTPTSSTRAPRDGRRTSSATACSGCSCDARWWERARAFPAARPR